MASEAWKEDEATALESKAEAIEKCLTELQAVRKMLGALAGQQIDQTITLLAFKRAQLQRNAALIRAE